MKRIVFRSLTSIWFVSCVPSASTGLTGDTSPVATSREVQPTERGQDSARLRLLLRAVPDPAARGLEPPMVLQVTLENTIGAPDRAMVDEALSLRRGTVPGVLELELRSETESLEHSCLVTAGSSTDPYIDLGPGESITRVIDLKCYHPPRNTKLWATVSYFDKRSDASVPSALAEMIYRGKLVSNTVEFVLATGD